MVATISREQLKAKIDRHDPFILAEVLAPGQYERAHLPGAVNLPPDRVTALAATLLPDKHQEIVVYCGGPTWHAAEQAAQVLAAHGYTNVKDYTGGKQEWMEAGLPTESAPAKR
jgi:rhodanese-related sulfurtransferase